MLSTSEEEPTVSVPDIKVLRAAIPSHCFRPSLVKSINYVVRDLILMAALFYGGWQLLDVQPSISRTILWTVYGLLQSFVFTGIWVLAHECGHNAFSIHRNINATIGFILHSIVLVPFFSWKYSHSRHHRYANHMEKDPVFVPQRKSEYRESLFTGDFLGHAEDAPLVSVMLFLGHQALGWPLYMIFNAGAGSRSLVASDRLKSTRQSHFDPGSDLFTARERPYVLLSNMGLAAVLTSIIYCAHIFGAWNMFLLYGIPYLWMNHWLVAITFLHHTHPEVPRYEEGTWTYEKGALSTIDRDFGFIGRHLFHGIIEYHTIHHIFPRIPFYYAEEATNSIKPLLGKAYVEQRSSFLYDLWSTFTTCDYVQEHRKLPGLVFWSKAT